MRTRKKLDKQNRPLYSVKKLFQDELKITFVSENYKKKVNRVITENSYFSPTKNSPFQAKT